MPLVDMSDLLRHAGRETYAVCAFDLASLDFLSAVVAAAENCRAPVILSMSEAHLEHIDGELLAPAMEAAARRAQVPVAIQFHRAATTESVVRAIRLGCNGVAIDASRPDDLAKTRAMVEVAHACGVPVEAGLNVILRFPPAAATPDAVTPAAARAFVEQTGVDFLAITEAQTGTARPRLDLTLLTQLQSELEIPLTVDGNQWITEADYPTLIRGGVVKINHYVGLSRAAADCLKQNIKSTHRNGYLTLVKGVREAICRYVERYLRLSGSAGRAHHAAIQCRQWQEVMHCIPYNVPADTGEREVRTMMASGRKSLAAIPGVRNVFTGRAVRADTQYRYCWLVRFTHPAVIASYRDHPDHVAFADNCFRPIAADRISIDFEEVS